VTFGPTRDKVRLQAGRAPASTDRTSTMDFSAAPFPRRTGTAAALLLAGAILLGAGPPTAWVTPGPVDLGTAARFAVLAGGGVRDTGPSTISGDVGTHPLPAIPDILDAEATGTVDRAGAMSKQAQLDLAIALGTAAALPRDGTVSLAGGRTLPSGVYAVSDAEQGVVASLTLDGQGATRPVWIFVVANDLVTAPGSAIALVNGAQACNVFWLVGGSATIASGSTFAGSVMATASVTVGQGVTIAGRLLSRTAAVSLGGDRISVPVCTLNAAQAAPQPAATALALSSRTPDAAAASPTVLPAYLPAVMLALLVLAAVLGEPRHRHRRRADRRGW
jgi:hypothetical protein